MDDDERPVIEISAHGKSWAQFQTELQQAVLEMGRPFNKTIIVANPVIFGELVAGPHCVIPGAGFIAMDSDSEVADWTVRVTRSQGMMGGV
jgi:hypothetical protein